MNIRVISSTVAMTDMWVSLCANIVTIETQSLINHSLCANIVTIETQSLINQSILAAFSLNQLRLHTSTAYCSTMEMSASSISEYLV